MKNRKLSSLSVSIAVLMALSMPASAIGEGNTLLVGPGQDYATIQAAVDAAKQGSRILVYPGYYEENVEITTNNLQVIAQGDDVIVKGIASMPAPGVFHVLADRVTIRGFEIAYGAGCAPGIEFEGSHNTFAENYIYLDATCFGVNALTCRDPDGGSDFNTIEGNTIHQADIGIIIQAATEDAINRGNIIRNNTLQSIAQLPIGVEGGSGSLITGNSIDEAPYGICIAIGTGVGNTIAQGHHTIVQNTMGYCANNGISLYAHPGTALAHNRISDNWIQTCGEDCIALEASSGSVLSDNQVSDNEVSFSGHCGITLGAYLDEPDAFVSDNLISGNTVYRNMVSGICLTQGANNNRVFKNLVQDDTVDGILVIGESNRLMGNTSRNNDRSGIRVEGENNRIFNNTASNNGNFDLEDEGTGNRWWNNEYETTNW